MAPLSSPAKLVVLTWIVKLYVTGVAIDCKILEEEAVAMSPRGVIEIC
jgi:hypothetical protein